jgi:SAM-dependent methyltransferase
VANVTRGTGLLERFLAVRRAVTVDRLIPSRCRDGRILDIGCGSYPLFLERCTVREKYGIDKSVDKIFTNQPMKGISLKCLDIELFDILPFESDYYDVVTMLAVFEHIDPICLVRLHKEIHRILKPTGIYVMTTPAPWTDGLLHLMARTGLVSHEEIHEHKGAYDSAKIVRILLDSNFERKNIHYGTFELFMNTWTTAVK